ncbi:endonuclease/exonuclease/phosphatase family protein [Sedimenticola sp.]|uniref:endonuclease/exonuclease/phosphatase family protein n=1 Tax=Sedimenticola sp. TaxID=1940285 RepID=UPI003D11D883
MRIITANLNGIRSAATRGFFEWFTRQKADVLCVQETRAQEHQLEAVKHYPRGFHAYFCDAEKRVAIYREKFFSNHAPLTIDYEGL